MEKRFCSLIAVLALAGAVVAGFLTYLHYYPGVELKFVICGGDYAGNCDALNQWKYATIFGIPVAGYGLFMFLWIMFTVLVADYAAGEYYRFGLMLVLPLVVLSLLADIVFFAVMIHFKTVCLLCVLTYFINILLFAVIWFWYRHLINCEGVSWREAYRFLLPKESDISAKKAASALYVLFVCLLFFAVFSTASILQMKTYSANQSKEQTKQTVESFYRQTVEKPILPESRLMVGSTDAKVKIVAFTDFLCSACFQLFQLEKDIYAKYGDKISITYYNYPLDQACNSSVQQTVYKSSCAASKAMLLAASLNVFPEYLEKHFSRYTEFHAQYSQDKALEVASELTDAKRFQEGLDSTELSQILQRDIELAGKLNIRATPTLFINGRRMEGVPPREILDAILERELRNTAAK